MALRSDMSLRPSPRLRHLRTETQLPDAMRPRATRPTSDMAIRRRAAVSSGLSLQRVLRTRLQDKTTAEACALRASDGDALLRCVCTVEVCVRYAPASCTCRSSTWSPTATSTETEVFAPSRHPSNDLQQDMWWRDLEHRSCSGFSYGSDSCSEPDGVLLPGALHTGEQFGTHVCALGHGQEACSQGSERDGKWACLTDGGRGGRGWGWARDSRR